MTVLTEFDLRGGSRITLRRAETGDVPAIVHLLADDELGANRDGINDDDDLTPYLSAFSAIDSDPAHLLVAADDGTAHSSSSPPINPGLMPIGSTSSWGSSRPTKG